MNSPKTRHVWCRPDLSVVEHQGLILSAEWERRGDVVGARVQYVVEATGRTVTEWLSSDRLHPVESQPNIGSAYG